jgi:hypothetical protein
MTTGVHVGVLPTVALDPNVVILYLSSYLVKV